ncbi:MAG: PKD domain-containing protein [Gammaproteobacteria bacterium]|nr:PKD domain-containing protein [Gammaproteobacteria bacterium]
MLNLAKAALASAVLVFVPSVQANSPAQTSIVAEYVSSTMDVLSRGGHYVKQQEIYAKDASFIKVHFSDFHPPPWMTIEVRNPEGTESYLYSRDFRDAHTFDAELGDDGVTSFSAMSISGDVVIVEVHGKPGHGKKDFKGRVFVDYVLQGLSPAEVSVQQSVKGKSSKAPTTQASGDIYRPESNCGADERYDAVCWAESEPGAFDRTRPVAKIIMGRTSCTAWRVGPDNLLFTNNHCISTQSRTAATEVWFNYQNADCGGPNAEEVVKVSGAELFSTDYTLDYSLFSVSDFAAIQRFGNFGLEVRDALFGEHLYIPQHGRGDPKQLSVESDMDSGGLCRVGAEDYTGRAAGTDIGYYCDTVGGSSGSPVVLASSNKAIALHHYGGCLNSGVKMSEIWPKVARHFDRIVPEGDNGGPLPDPDPAPDEAPTAAFGFVCSYLDCSFDGGASSDPEGPIEAYSWSFGDGQTGSGITPAHSFGNADSYTVTLTVLDSTGNPGTVAKTVTVSTEVNTPPVAEFQSNCDALTCTFDAGQSFDPDGEIAAYYWDFGDGGVASVAAATHTYAASGTYEVVLRVEDIAGAQGALSRNVTVNAVVSPPPVFSTIELTGVGFKVKGKKWAELTWNGSEASQMEILRDGVKLIVTENSGQFRDDAVLSRVKSAVYQVCELATDTCSNEFNVRF